MKTAKTGNRVLVTGASGFIGEALVRGLVEEGYAVRGLVRSRFTAFPADWPVEFIQGDIRSSDVTNRAVEGMETVFHLAAKVHDLKASEDDPTQHSVTFGGTQTIVKSAVKAGVRRFIFFSSQSVYGKSGYRSREESDVCRPTDSYGRAKLEAESVVLEEGVRRGMSVSCLRPATVYGPGCKGNLTEMIRAIDRRRFLPIPTLDNPRSLLYVGNLVDAALRTFQSQAAGRIYNVTDGRDYTPRELFELICRSLGRSIPRWEVPLPVLKVLALPGTLVGHVLARRLPFDKNVVERLTEPASCSCARIGTELGYRPSTTFEVALPELIRWYRQNKNGAGS